jgi:hypothetical protein
LNVSSWDGWKGSRRVFIRVDRGDDDTAIVRVVPLNEGARNEGLLCCLRQTQSALVMRLLAGMGVRFVLNMDNGEMKVSQRVVSQTAAQNSVSTR